MKLVFVNTYQHAMAIFDGTFTASSYSLWWVQNDDIFPTNKQVYNLHIRCSSDPYVVHRKLGTFSLYISTMELNILCCRIRFSLRKVVKEGMDSQLPSSQEVWRKLFQLVYSTLVCTQAPFFCEKNDVICYFDKKKRPTFFMMPN